MTGVCKAALLSRFYLERSFVTTSALRKQTKSRKKFVQERTIPIKSKKPVAELWPNITIQEIAKMFNTTSNELIDDIRILGFVYAFRPSNTVRNPALMAGLGNRYGYRVRIVNPPNPEALAEESEEQKYDVFPRSLPPDIDLVQRPPVVTIMGHVDHGKTTLLDSLRQSQIVDSEFGGITQHIGAFMVDLDGDKITFLDTPGHAAFKAMRERGARMTDIVILVVAADDGVLDQTLESIRYAREANVPMVVAINKIDKPDADIERTKRTLLEAGVQLEEFGGSVQAVAISALRETNLSQLLEAVLVEAEVYDVRGDPVGLVEGAVIEVQTEKGLGPVSTVLVKRGELKKGTILVGGETWCRVRLIHDEHGKELLKAGLSAAVRISGWREGLPSAGDVILEVETEAKAKDVVSFRKRKAQEREATAAAEANEAVRAQEKDAHWEEKLEAYKKGRLKLRQHAKPFQTKLETISSNRLDILVKGDVDGSVGAIKDVLETYNSSQCALTLIDISVGAVSEADVEQHPVPVDPYEQAKLFDGIIYAFNTPTTPQAEAKAMELGVEIRHFNIIYRLVEVVSDRDQVEDLKLELSKKLEPIPYEAECGAGVVVQVFRLTPPGKKKHCYIAGTKCNEGKIGITDSVRVVRKGEVVHTGQIESLYIEKTAVSSASANENVGILFKASDFKIAQGDEIQAYRLEKRPQELDWHPPGF